MYTKWSFSYLKVHVNKKVKSEFDGNIKGIISIWGDNCGKILQSYM